MRRAVLVAVLCLAGSCRDPNDRNLPRLCVSSFSTDAGLCDPADPQEDYVPLTEGGPILVQHSLPVGVDAYGNKVKVVLGSPAGNEVRELDYAQPLDAGFETASAIFDFPDGGACYVTVSASILNSQITVSSHGSGCP